jgi:hypothetical protein
MALEIQVMALDRHKKSGGVKWFMGLSIQCTHVLVYGTLHPMYSCFSHLFYLNGKEERFDFQ